MKAAVVTSFDTPPRYADFADPVPAEGELVLDVVAAGLHPRVRSQADGSHYTSPGELPFVPGVDGVGRDDEGTLRYFVLDDTAFGSMAERVAVDARRSIVLPGGTDPVAVAAAMNPAMSSWVSLRSRIDFEPGQSVLILGATGNAGRMAIRSAKLLGASRVVAAGRDAQKLAELTAFGADDTVRFDGTGEASKELAAKASEVDVVIDYVWGEQTPAAMVAIVTARPDRRKPLTWIEVGSVAGLTAELPSAAFRAARLQLVGSGQGSLTPREYLEHLPELAGHISRGAFDVDVRAVPLAEAEQAWADAATERRRIVLVP
ncbi:quinone oxidoreductase family protein [Gryllotalpicola ginsengisoli]|uniref:quinone oxidoreductase family protein n=1 Tax=Gryllotalpicola ginsengisoli TaxID=444608 RepID=UPI0003B3B59B|nr:zinc-binding alcohol dehydrogenase family protein [Gryllotalpicola ginsengisoli]